LIGGSFSVLLRFELATPGSFYNNAQLYNRILTAHAFYYNFLYGYAWFGWWFW